MLHWYRRADTDTTADYVLCVRLLLLCFIHLAARSTFSKLNIPEIVMAGKLSSYHSSLFDITLASPTSSFLLFFRSTSISKACTQINFTVLSLFRSFCPFAKLCSYNNHHHNTRNNFFFIVFIDFQRSASVVRLMFPRVHTTQSVARTRIKEFSLPLFWLTVLFDSVNIMCLFVCVFATSNVIWQMIVSRWPSNL